MDGAVIWVAATALPRQGLRVAQERRSCVGMRDAPFDLRSPELHLLRSGDYVIRAAVVDCIRGVDAAAKDVRGDILDGRRKDGAVAMAQPDRRGPKLLRGIIISTYVDMTLDEIISLLYYVRRIAPRHRLLIGVHNLVTRGVVDEEVAILDRDAAILKRRDGGAVGADHSPRFAPKVAGLRFEPPQPLCASTERNPPQHNKAVNCREHAGAGAAGDRCAGARSRGSSRLLEW